MIRYLLKRLLLLPMTLGFILLLNFAIIHLVPGDPATLSATGENAVAKSGYGGEHNRQFRLRYGLTLPILWNSWNFLSVQEVHDSINQLIQDPRRSHIGELKDESPYILRQLHTIMNDDQLPEKVRKIACELFLTGSIKVLPTNANSDEFRISTQSNQRIDDLREQFNTTQAIPKIDFHDHELKFWSKCYLALTETRFIRYLSRVFCFDFGTRRNDPYVPVVDIVLHKMRYSLTLSALPYFGTFIFAIFIGLYMAARSGKVVESTLDLLLLILFAIPIFVVAPYFLEKAVYGLKIPFTSIQLPLHGFSSDSSIYDQMTSLERLKDIARHLVLPVLCLSYNLLAVHTRLAKASFVEAASKESVRFCISRGLSSKQVWFHHILPNGSIPLVTLAAGSLGVLLGGSVIIETLFEIPGFGKFFYDAILERDYNVLLFSALVGSFLTLVGYLIGDIVYCLLDPRIDFEVRNS